MLRRGAGWQRSCVRRLAAGAFVVYFALPQIERSLK
jgi:hypothetical protein